jgi:hypothetical protein
MFCDPYEVTVLIDACNTLENEVKAKVRKCEGIDCIENFAVASDLL